MPTYAYTALVSAVDSNLPSVVSATEKLQLHNQAVREVLQEIDLRSTIRNSSLSPNLFDDVYDYAWPSDGKDFGVIDIIPQVGRVKEDEFELIPAEEFDRIKSNTQGVIAFVENALSRKLRISRDVDDSALLVSTLDSLTAGGGTWSSFGDAENLTQDSDNFVKGNASINWDIDSAGGTTAGIQNTDVDTFDITDYTAEGSIFCWVYLSSSTDVTNFIIRIGNDVSNYFSDTITATHEGNAFADGWNLLRFDFNGASETGSVDKTACDYVVIYMTKDSGKVSETDYRFDHIIIRRGKIYDLKYYSKFGWQTSAGTFLENSTAGTDKLNADTEEFQLIVQKSTELHLRNLEKHNAADRAFSKYNVMVYGDGNRRQGYIDKYPSERKVLTQTYYNI